MSESELEAVVLEYLECREQEPTLRPEEFLLRRPDVGEGALGAIRAALAVERMFPAEPQPIRSIGPYRIVDEIGRGGMGIVYRAERDGRSFALKLLPLAPVLAPRMLERFRREAQSLAQLSHPGIVRVHDAATHDEMPYFVMDLVEGQPLHQLAGSITTEQAIRLTTALAGILEAAHRRGILHRDLKPQNVMVQPDGTPVLLDFGLSVAEDLPSLTLTDEVLGTPRYMAPEQALGQPADARTDIYALGLILFELVTRHPAREPAGREALLEAARLGQLPRPRAVAPALSRPLENILLTALARDPARRYPDAASFADDLRRLHRGEPVAARPPGVVTRVVEALRARRRQGRGFRTPAAEPDSATRQEASRHLDQATALWIDGDTAGARDEVERARRLDPGDPTAALLAAHLSGRPAGRGEPSSQLAAREALRFHETGAYAESVERMRGCSAELRGALVSAVVGLGAARSGDLPLALDELGAAARLLPRSVRIQRALAGVCLQLERLDDGARAFRRVIELGPASAQDWLGLAEICLRKRDLDEGLRAVAAAESVAGLDQPAILRLRATLEVHAGRHAEARGRLARLLELDARDVEASFQLASSLDSDHDLIGAERAYRRVLELDPHHARALVALAYLHSGASRGQCRACDQVFDAHPEYVDSAKSEHYLLRGLDADRGRSESVTFNIRDIALRLAHRDSVLASLERLTLDATSSPSVLRLKDVLRRLRLTSA